MCAQWLEATAAYIKKCISNRAKIIIVAFEKYHIINQKKQKHRKAFIIKLRYHSAIRSEEGARIVI